MYIHSAPAWEMSIWSWTLPLCHPQLMHLWLRFSQGEQGSHQGYTDLPALIVPAGLDMEKGHVKTLVSTQGPSGMFPFPVMTLLLDSEEV